MTTPARPWAAAYVLCTGVLMIVLDTTVVNVALPVIRTDLGFSQSSLAWIVNAYLIAFGGLLLFGGRLGDLLGRRRVFLTGLSVFTAASACCALSTGQTMLIIGRFAQGVGGALASSVTLAMIVTMFSDPAERAKAIGGYGFVASAGSAIGLLAGGAITQALSWHWIFLLNIPLGIVTVLLTRRLVPAGEGLGVRAGADLPGALSLTGGLMLGVWTILGVENNGWASARTMGFGVLTLLLLGGFVFRQRRAATPLMPLRVVRSRLVCGANIVQFLLVMGMFSAFFFGALYLGGVLGFDALDVGLAFLPAALSMGLTSLRVSGMLSARLGPQRTLLIGLVLTTAGLLYFARLPAQATYLEDVLAGMVLFGTGAGLSFPPIMALAMSGATSEDAGLASGLVNTSEQIGGAVGLSVLTTIASGHTRQLLANGATEVQARVGGHHTAFLAAAGFVAVAATVTATVLRPRLGGRPNRGTNTPAEDGLPVSAVPKAKDVAAFGE